MSYNSNKNGGPCWSSSRGYHTPQSFPLHIQRIIQKPKKPKKEREPTNDN
jgi:hypothetical protein